MSAHIPILQAYFMDFFYLISAFVPLVYCHVQWRVVSTVYFTWEEFVARLGMLIDLRTCIGCHACSIACKAEFDVPLGVFRDTVKYVEEGKYPKATRHFIPVLCNHCEDAPCLKACPTGAIIRVENGEVVINKSDCNVNRFCMAACPYGAYTSTRTKMSPRSAPSASTVPRRGCSPHVSMPAPRTAVFSVTLTIRVAPLARRPRATVLPSGSPRQGRSPACFMSIPREHSHTLRMRVSKLIHGRSCQETQAQCKAHMWPPPGSSPHDADVTTTA